MQSVQHVEDAASSHEHHHQSSRGFAEPAASSTHAVSLSEQCHALANESIHSTRSPTGYLDSSGAQLNEVFPPESDPQVWKQAMAKNKHTHKMEDIAANVVDHLTTTLARAPFNADDLSMYQSTALAVRDELITVSRMCAIAMTLCLSHL